MLFVHLKFFTSFSLDKFHAIYMFQNIYSYNSFPSSQTPNGRASVLWSRQVRSPPLHYISPNM